MKYLMVILVCLFMQGCWYQTINKSDISAAEQVCKAAGSEVFEIFSYWDGTEKVTCLNRKTLDL